MIDPAVDCPECPVCRGPSVTTDPAAELEFRLFCAACGHIWEPTGAQWKQAQRADRFYENRERIYAQGEQWKARVEADKKKLERLREGRW